MTKSAYIIGGAGTGKSTFTQAVLDRIGEPLSPLLDIHQKPNSRGTVITLRGHEVGNRGLYLGCMRDEFPGTDGLDRLSYIPGEEWLESSAQEGVDWIIGEGNTLAVRRFLEVLNDTTDLLLVHLVAEDFVKDIRFTQRGSNQKESFVKSTATQSANLFERIPNCWKIQIDTADPQSWETAVSETVDHLLR